MRLLQRRGNVHASFAGELLELAHGEFQQLFPRRGLRRGGGVGHPREIGGDARGTNKDHTHGQLPALLDVIIEEGASLFVSAVGVPQPCT